MLAFFELITRDNVMMFLFGVAIILSFIYGAVTSAYYKRVLQTNFWLGAFGIGLIWALSLIDVALEKNFPESDFLAKYRLAMPIVLAISVIGTSIYSYKKVKSIKLFVFLFLKQVLASPAAAFGIFLFPIAIIAAAGSRRKYLYGSRKDIRHRRKNE